jgi:acyl carrier protein
MADDEVRKRVVQALVDVMGVDASQLGDDTSPDTLETWDSLSHVNLVLALEEEFGVRFSDEETLRMLSIPKILTALGAKQAR